MLHESWVPHHGVEVLEFDSTCSITATTRRTPTTFHSSAPKMPPSRPVLPSETLRPAAFQWFKQAGSRWQDGRAGLHVAKWSAVAAFWATLVKRSVSPRVVARHVRSDALGDNILTPLAASQAVASAEVVWIWAYARPVVPTKAVHTFVEEACMDAEAEEALFAGVDAVVFAFPELSARCGRPRVCRSGLTR